MSRAWAILLLWTAASSCEKASPEPPIQRAGSVANSAPSLDSMAAPAAARRVPKCVKPTAPAPPPSPAHAVDPRCPRDPAGGSPMVPVGHVSFPESRDVPRLEVELMLTPGHHERGLMYRRSLADDKGMLFVWNQPALHSFWMHNTCIPLDMMFIDREGFVAGIVENAPTMNDDPQSIDCPATYVLEVNAGWSRKHGVVAGQRVELEGLPR